MMKKWWFILIALLLLFGVVGCGPAGIVITITPDPITFTSGDDLIDGTIKVSTSGFGSLTVDGVVIKIIEKTNGETPKELLSFNTDDHLHDLPISFPLTLPISFNGMYSEEFDIQDDLLGVNYNDGFTVNDLISELPEEYEIKSYEDLKGSTYVLKVVISGSSNSTKEVNIIFN